MRSRRRPWWIFAACTLAVAAAMAWMTAAVLRHEHSEQVARRDAEHQIELRLALWRMDSWLAPLLAREAARPYFEYRAFFPQEKAYTRILNAIRPGEVLTPSPLLTFRSKLFPLHFQYDEKGDLTSPQVPRGNLLDLSEGQLRVATMQARQRLAELAGLIGFRQLSERWAITRQKILTAGCAILPQGSSSDSDQLRALSGVNDFANRANVNFTQQMAVVPGGNTTRAASAAGVEVDPLLPEWVSAGDGTAPQLLYVRRVRLPDRTLMQGLLVDWDELEKALLERVADLPLSTSVSLTPTTEQDPAHQDSMLATVPARIDAARSAVPLRASASTLALLAAAWLAVITTIAGVGLTLRSVLALGERRARFASAVTHELRTPLTTFRMYSEMLANDMVVEPDRRTEYLRTLEREASRLARLVENVLCYARLEEGRYRGRHQRVAAGALVDQVAPVLQQRARETGMELAVEVADPLAEVDSDPDAIGQILFNLVDNACKYAAGSDPARIELRARRREGWLDLEVRDHGPGVGTEHRGAVFEPFERGERTPGDNEAPGIGLGLALARALAGDLGGSLELRPDRGRGATFALALPLAA